MIDPVQPVLSLRDAQVNGFKWYTHGRPCARGHSSLRYTATRQCVQCIKENAAAKRTRRLKRPPKAHPWRLSIEAEA